MTKEVTKEEKFQIKQQEFLRACSRLGELVYAYETLPTEIEAAKARVKAIVSEMSLSASVGPEVKNG